MRKVLKSLVSLLVIATMLLSMASVSFASNSETTGEIKLSTDGIKEVTFGGEKFTGVELTVTAVVPGDYFAGWDEGVVGYDSSLFEFAGYEAVDFADDWGDINEWPLVECTAYPATGEVKIGLGAYQVIPYGTQAVLKLYFKASDLEAASGKTATFIPFGNLVSKEDEGYTYIFGVMDTTLTNAEVSFPVIAPEVEVYTITYMIDGDLYTTVECEAGATVTPLAAPSKDGYTFNGWVGEPAIMPNEDVVVTGSWTKNEEPQPGNLCGTNAYWTLEDGVLSITGTGAITSYTGSNVAPWEASADLITEINIAEGITAIGNRAFMKLTAVEEITLPSTIETIGNYAFLNSIGLTTINMPVVSSIGSSAFTGCSALTAVNMTGSVADYKAMEIAGNTNTEFLRADITITDGDVDAKAGMSVYATWVYNPADKSLEIGNCPGVASRDMLNFKTEDVVPWAAFIDTIETVKVEGVALVGSRTMIGSSSLKKLDVISETVKRVNSWAFYNATALETVTLPASIEALGTGAFYGNALTSVTSAATKAQYDAITFAKSNDAFKRTTVVLADAVQGFHSAASSAQTINWYLVGDTLTITGTGNMAGKDSADVQPWYSYKDQIKNLVIEEGVTQIGKYGFAELTNVEEVTIPSTVTNVQAAAFRDMTSLKKVTLSPGITTIGTNAFNGCTVLEEVNFTGKQSEYDVMTIGSGNTPFTKAALTTDENTYVAKGVIGSTITWSLTDTGVLRVMGTGALPNYSSSTVQPWKDNMASITQVIIGEGITKIGNQAFANATALETIDLPVSVTSIGNYATNKSGLATINYAGTAEQFAAISVGSSNAPFTAATVNYAN